MTKIAIYKNFGKQLYIYKYTKQLVCLDIKEQNKCQGRKYIHIKWVYITPPPLKEKEIFHKKISFTNVL